VIEQNVIEQEGVIKYQLHFQQEAVISASDIVEIDSWRHVFHRLQLIGQMASRYHGYGFGNISQRFHASEQFIISGTQTGEKPFLKADDYALVTECYPHQNKVVAAGQTAPSSESMTHGQLYQLDESIQFIIHAHSPDIWQKATVLNIPQTRQAVEYGSVAMVEEVERLFNETDVKQQKIFSMAGHVDGIVSFGATAEEAAQAMIQFLAASFRQ